MSERTNYPTLLCVRGYPRELRDLVTDAARARAVNANDFVVSVLADHYDVAFTPGTRPIRARRSDEFPHAAPPNQRDPGTTLQLRVPPELNAKIHMEAAYRRTLIRDLVLGELATFFSVGYTAPVLKRGRRKETVA